MEGETRHEELSTGAPRTEEPAQGLQNPRLPQPATPLIGREREVAEVCALLARDTVRLVTLTGPGGIGKTRLALAVADALGGESSTGFRDGVHCVSLAQLTDPVLVLQAIEQGLSTRKAAASGRKLPLPERLQRLIDRQRILLVLDNFEQVIGAALDIAGFLDGCPNLKIVVTSREVLRLSAEYCYPVPPLALPDLENLPRLKFLAQVEAVRLFVTRALAVQPDFALTEQNAAAVAAIGHRLDGLPLAIELAAARVRLQPPAAMLAGFGRLTLLIGGARDKPARHQTLRNAIAWSYDLLGPDEQRMFRRLTVFAGGCTLDAAVTVGSGQSDAVQTIASLLDKSLLRRAAAEEERLYMLETIREYALEQLEASGEAEEARRAHALCYLAPAEEGEVEVVGPNQTVWLARLEQEHDNLRAALAWAVGGDDPPLGARLASALWRFWLIHGHLDEGRRWLDAVMSGGHSLPRALRARALNAAGRLTLRQGDYTSAQAMLEESLALRRSLGDQRGLMQTLDNLGLTALYQDDLPRAQSYFEQSLAGWRLLGEKLGISNSLNHVGIVLRYRGEYDLAAQFYNECRELARDLHDKFPMAAALHNLGQMAHHLGDDATARPLLCESLLLVRQINDRPHIGVGLADLAGMWAAQGQAERAARLFGAAEALSDQTHAGMYRAQQLAYEKDVARGAAQLDEATWQAAWAEGRAMPLDDACALAIEELPPPDLRAQPPQPGPFDLTERELEVLRLLAAGLTYSQIAEQLTLSFHTVHAHARSIYSKLGVTSRSHAARLAVQHGLA
jgi:predicted ATPase/DNA-binding CsgD family transcriptional regulator